jgi:hypothetical protein
MHEIQEEMDMVSRRRVLSGVVLSLIVVVAIVFIQGPVEPRGYWTGARVLWTDRLKEFTGQTEEETGDLEQEINCGDDEDKDKDKDKDKD